MPVTRRTLATTTAALSAALAGLDDPPLVGIDVERADAHNYWRRPALIQLGADGVVVLCDPLAAVDLAVLDAFLSEKTIVLHAMDNDIAPLAAVGVTLDAIEDTAVAAAILGLPTGLEALLDALLDIRFNGDKRRMQRADWSKRPLSEPMLAYAAADVADLPALWRALREQLDATGRWDWYVQERDAMRSQPPLEERRSWRRLRGVGRLDRGAQARARALWKAREALARDTDTAPNRIVNDRVLLDVAATPPDDVDALRRAGVRRQAARRFGAQLLRAMRTSETAPPIRPRGRRFSDEDRALIDDLRARRSRVAARIGVDPGVLCPNRALEQAVATGPTTLEAMRTALALRPWQWALMADEFADALEQADRGTPGTSAEPTA